MLLLMSILNIECVKGIDMLLISFGEQIVLNLFVYILDIVCSK